MEHKQLHLKFLSLKDEINFKINKTNRVIFYNKIALFFILYRNITLMREKRI